VGKGKIARRAATPQMTTTAKENLYACRPKSGALPLTGTFGWSTFQELVSGCINADFVRLNYSVSSILLSSSVSSVLLSSSVSSEVHKPQTTYEDPCSEAPFSVFFNLSFLYIERVPINQLSPMNQLSCFITSDRVCDPV
jgi:hypothetical protein